MHDHDLKFSVAFSLPSPMEHVALAHLIEIIVRDDNEQRARRFGTHRQLHLVDMPSPFNPAVQWVGVTAPYMHGMLLLCEPHSSEYGIANGASYTQVSLTYLGTNKSDTPLEWRTERKVLEDLQFLGRALLTAVIFA